MRVDEHTIELAGSPIYYRSAPASGVQPFYLHGVPTSSDDWTGFLARTGGLAPDLIGFGRSGKAGNLDYSIDGLTDFLESLLAALEVGRVQLVAHDWGAAVGLAFAQRHPDRVKRLVLLNAVPLLDGFRWHRLARIWRTPLLGELVMGSTSRRLLARSLREGTTDPSVWTDERIAAVYKQFDQGTQRAILRLYRSAGEQQLARAGAELGRLTMPALVVWGARDPWLAPQFGERYANALPDATLERVPDGGHWPWLEQPDMIERVASFLGMT